jgi:hypothetical protein
LLLPVGVGCRSVQQAYIARMPPSPAPASPSCTACTLPTPTPTRPGDDDHNVIPKSSDGPTALKSKHILAIHPSQHRGGGGGGGCTPAHSKAIPH